MAQKKPGRNIVNIPQLQKQLDHFARQNNLPTEIADWVRRTFLRWLVNAFPYTQEVLSAEYFRTLVGAEPPQWFLDKETSVTFWFIDPNHHHLKTVLQQTTEWLLTQYPDKAKKFPRMTVEQVLQQWQTEHERLYKRQQQYTETSGTGLIARHEYQGFSIVEFDHQHAEAAFEMARESALMQHCLGDFDDVENAAGGYGAHYYQSMQQGEMRLFSLRDRKNRPHATLSLWNTDHGLTVEQIKGKQNRPPIDKYVPAITQFLNQYAVQHDGHPDCLSMGLVFDRGTTKPIAEVEDEGLLQKLMAHDPRFIPRIKNPSQPMLWYIATHHPQYIALFTTSSDAMRIMALMQKPSIMNDIKLQAPISAKHILQQNKPMAVRGRAIVGMKLQVLRK